jgi:NAD(P)-dependent dehydrogenase (short-subunit alcohol dehydrogenase family)
MGHAVGGFNAYTTTRVLRSSGLSSSAAFEVMVGTIMNHLFCGGVLTPLNECVMNDPVLWGQIMDETPLKRWAAPEEIAEWAYFLTVTNTFCTGQNILVDGGEAINYHFIWKE